MQNKSITVEEIRKIVNAEVKKAFKDEFKKELTAAIKHGQAKDDVQAAIKTALNNLYKFMWTKRNTWNSEIR